MKIKLIDVIYYILNIKRNKSLKKRTWGRKRNSKGEGQKWR